MRKNKISTWSREFSPKELNIGFGWFREFDKVFVDKNKNYAVLSREIETDWGKVIHAAIRNNAGCDIPWIEKQRIKNELFGSERIAVEVFPKESELIDSANMYHLWIFDKKFKLPFTIHQ